MNYETKRRAKTSTAAKARYNKKAYDQIAVRVPKDLAAEFRAKCAAAGVPQAQIIRQAMEDFLRG